MYDSINVFVHSYLYTYSSMLAYFFCTHIHVDVFICVFIFLFYCRLLVGLYVENFTIYNLHFPFITVAVEADGS
jgi:hypothetical protein